MYILKPGIKQNPEKRWALPDRIFFGHGACHILAGVYLSAPPLNGFHAERIIPSDEMFGNHIFVTDGEIAFDYHGYTVRERLLEHHRKVWSSQFEAWDCRIDIVDFDMLCTNELNARKMRGPDQYFQDPVERAKKYLQRIDHRHAFARCTNALSNSTVQSSVNVKAHLPSFES